MVSEKKNRLAVIHTFLLPMNLARKNIECYGLWGNFVDKIAGTMCEVLLAAAVISARKLACSALFGDVRQITYSCNLMSYVSCNYVPSYLQKFQLFCAESNLSMPSQDISSVHWYCGRIKTNKIYSFCGNLPWMKNFALSCAVVLWTADIHVTRIMIKEKDFSFIVLLQFMALKELLLNTK